LLKFLAVRASMVEPDGTGVTMSNRKSAGHGRSTPSTSPKASAKATAGTSPATSAPATTSEATANAGPEKTGGVLVLPKRMAAAAVQLEARLAKLAPLPAVQRKCSRREAALVALSLVSLARRPELAGLYALVDDRLLSLDMVDELEVAAHALLVSTKAEAAKPAVVSAELIERAYGMRRRFYKLAHHHLDEDEAVMEAIAEVDLVRSPIKVGEDLLRLKKALAPHQAFLSQDLTVYRAEDFADAFTVGKTIVDAFAEELVGTVDEDRIGRLWAALVELYGDIRGALWLLTRKRDDAPALPGFWQTIHRLRREKAKKKKAVTGDTAIEDEAENEEEEDADESEATALAALEALGEQDEEDDEAPPVVTRSSPMPSTALPASGRASSGLLSAGGSAGTSAGTSEIGGTTAASGDPG
jgi:hypothetical protein